MAFPGIRPATYRFLIKVNQIGSLTETLDDKPVVLFGSYDWGTGEWMDIWKEDAETAGVNVIATVIANLEPDEEAEEALRDAAAKM